MTDPRERDITERFERYVAAFRRGEGDPGPAMSGLDREGRERLGRRIEEFLETGPVPDPEFVNPDDPRVQKVVAGILPQLDGRAGGLSRLLARQRHRLGLTQESVVDSLADDLDATEDEKPKIEAYYHDLEWGSLPAAGLADRLLDSLAAALHTTRDALREAGHALGPGRAASTGPVYARTVDEVGHADDLVAADIGPDVLEMRSASPPDRIDELFTGG